MNSRFPLVAIAAGFFGLTTLLACPNSDKASDPARAKNAISVPGPMSDQPMEAARVAARPRVMLGEKEAAEQAKKIAQKVIVTDGHVDLPYRLHNGLDKDGKVTEDVSKRTKEGDFDYVRAKEGGLDAPFMSIYTPARLETYEEKGKPVFNGSKKLADELIDLVEGVAKSHPDKFALATSVADVRKFHAAGKIALPMGMENGSPLEGDLKNVKHFYDRGIRYITLAHSADNHLADSSYDERHTNGGLTEFGKEVVKEMNRLGIFIDISHLSDQAAEQAIATSAVPVIASHSSCRHFTPDWERNISDELIKKVAADGGVVMINFGSTFLDDDLRKSGTKRWEAWKEIEAVKGWTDEEAKKKAKKEYYDKNKLGFSTVEKAADHVEHVIHLVGIDHVGFGSDFDGVGDSLPEGLKDVSYYPNLIKVLLMRGYNEEDVTKIAGENTLRVWSQLEAHANKVSK